MKWKDKILKQKEQGRIPEQYFGIVLANVEQAINEYKLELLDNIEILYQNSNKNKDSIEERNKSAYYTRLETIQEIIKIINK
mgnify:FL=1